MENEWDMKEHIPATLHVASIFLVFLMATFIEFRLPLPVEITSLLGACSIVLGAFLISWAVLHLKKGITGELKPKTEELVKEGPYRFIRHPTYLGMIILFIGFFIWVKSFTGVIGVFTLFLPPTVYRAKLEEEALHQKFGNEWDSYTDKTGFIFPSLKNKRR